MPSAESRRTIFSRASVSAWLSEAEPGRRRREAEALVHMRTYQEEVAEALEATGLADTKDGTK